MELARRNEGEEFAFWNGKHYVNKDIIVYSFRLAYLFLVTFLQISYDQEIDPGIYDYLKQKMLSLIFVMESYLIPSLYSSFHILSDNVAVVCFTYFTRARENARWYSNLTDAWIRTRSCRVRDCQRFNVINAPRSSR